MRTWSHEWLFCCWVFTGVLNKNHLSDLAILTLNDFHLACSIHVFPPTQQPTAGKETLRQAGRRTKDTLLLLQ